MKKMLMVLASVFVLSAVSYGGWEHIGGRTYWVDGPTPASLFIRDNLTGNVCPALAPLSYYDTPRLATNATASTISCGFFEIDATSGNIHSIANVGIADYENKAKPGWRYDVEWEVNSSGNLQLKQ